MQLALDPEQGLAYRYALHHLNPFVVSGDDSIYVNHQLSDYELFNPQTGQGKLTEAYLQDRAEMLAIKNQVYLGDLPQHEVTGVDARQYQATLLDDELRFTVDGINDVHQQKIIFDQHDSELLTGTGYDDRIYAGLDALDDVLTGNRGNDYLEGGQGNDIYIYREGDGFDVVLDTDGLGAIDYKGEYLSGGKLLADGIYQSDDQQVTYIYDETHDGYGTLLIDNTIRVEDFHNGDLGIVLMSEVPGLDVGRVTDSGSEAVDILLSPEQAAYMAGYAGSDWLSASLLDDQLYGGSGNDWLFGNAGNDFLEGGEGADLIMPGTGNNVIHAGDGNDVVMADRVISKNTNGAFIDERRFWYDLGEHLSVTSPEQLYLDADNQLQLLIETRLPDQIMEGESFDGQMRYRYQPETRSLSYLDQQGNDLFELSVIAQFSPVISSEENAISGGQGDDLLLANAGDDVLHGGAGNDRLAGKGGEDVLAGGAGDDLLLGGADNDLLLGGHDADFIIGGSGRDRLYGGEGNDTLFGDQDYLGEDAQQEDWLFGEAGDDVLVGHGGSDYLSGGKGNDVLLGDKGSDRLFGEMGNDLLQGGAGQDYLSGGDGADRIYGEEDDDYLEGQSGDDQIFGGEGDDTLIAGPGSDRSEGGAGADSYVFNIGDGEDLVDDDSTGNILRFGHGIGRERVKVSYDTENKQNLLVEYGSNDRITIRNFFLNQFSSVEFADEPNASYPFSSLMQAYTPLPLDITPNTHFFEMADSIENTPDQLMAETDVINADPSGNDLQREDIRSAFIRDMQSYVLDGLNDYGFIEIAAGIYEKPPKPADSHRYFIQANGEAHVYQIDTETFKRSEKDLSITHLDSWQGTDSYTELKPVTIPYVGGVPIVLPGTEELVSLDGYSGAGEVNGIRQFSRIEYQQVEHTYDVTWQRLSKTVNQVYAIAGEQDNQIDLGSSHFNIIQAGTGDDVVKGAVSGDQYSQYQGGYAEMPFLTGYRFAMPGNYLDGGAGDDVIEGSEYEDILIGGSGNDVLAGGGGNDSYYLNVTNGHDQLYDNGWTSKGENLHDVIVLPAGVMPGDLVFTTDTQLYQAPITWQTEQLALPMLHAAITMQWSDESSVTVVLPHNDRNAGFGIDAVQFADNAIMSFENLLAAAGWNADQNPHEGHNKLNSDQSFSGGPGDDELSLESVPFVIQRDEEEGRGYSEIEWNPDEFPYLVGDAGYDKLYGGEANDVLVGGQLHSRSGERINEYWGTLNDIGNEFTGGQGDDLIWATAGDDIFAYNLADGHDRVTDMIHGYDFNFDFYWDPVFSTETLQHYQNGKDTLRFGAGIASTDVTVVQSGNDLVFDILDGAGSVSFYNWYNSDANQLSKVEFESGGIWGESDISRLAQGLPLNASPQVNQLIGEIAIGNDVDFSYQINNAFVDSDIDDELTFQISLSSGEPLPGWLAYDASANSLQASQYFMQTGHYELLISATDTYGEKAEQNFSLKIEDQFIEKDTALWRGFLPGTMSDDRLIGADKNDFLVGLKGDDRLKGGKGDDLLFGGQGNDAYFFSPGDGHDEVIDNSGANVLVFEQLGLWDITLEKQGEDLLVSTEDQQDSMLVRNMFNTETPSIDKIVFEDGMELVSQELDNLISSMAVFNREAPGGMEYSGDSGGDSFISNLAVFG